MMVLHASITSVYHAATRDNSHLRPAKVAIDRCHLPLVPYGRQACLATKRMIKPWLQLIILCHACYHTRHTASTSLGWHARRAMVMSMQLHGINFKRRRDSTWCKHIMHHVMGYGQREDQLDATYHHGFATGASSTFQSSTA